MFKLIYRGGRLSDHIFDSILVAKPIGAFDRVIHVPGPMIWRVIAQGRGDTALCRHRMRTGWEHFGNASRLQTSFRTAHSGAQTRSAGADDDGVICMVNNLICV